MGALQMIQQLPVRAPRAPRTRGRNRYGLEQSDVYPFEQSPESYAPAWMSTSPITPQTTTYGGALVQSILHPISSTEAAASQLASALSSNTPISSTLQNLAGSLSQGQVNSLIAQCQAGVAQAGETDSGQCADLVNSVVAQANATPIDVTGAIKQYLDSLLPGAFEMPTWAWIALGALGIFLIYQVVS